MNYLLKIVMMLIILVTASNFAFAGSSQGPVYAILIHEPDLLMFDTGPIYGSPPCNTQDQWAIKMNTILGKAMLATLLSAQAQGKEVFALGYSQTCAAWGDRELPTYIIIID